MQKFIIFIGVLIFSMYNVNAQDTLYVENFETGGVSFLLNTTDVSSTSGGANHFIINNEYNGGNGTTICLGSSFTVPNTDAQPAGIYNNPDSYYLHTLSDDAQQNGIFSCCFLAADGIFCLNAENYFSKMDTDINTSNYSNVTLTFWWLCDGGNNSFGEIYYSTNAGSNWAKCTTPIQKYNNSPSWTQQTISIPAFSGQSQLRFGFRFVNSVTLAASDPGFAVDDIMITGSLNQILPVAAFTASDSSFCEKQCIDFFDQSANATSWNWYFQGAQPDTSTAQNPLGICYNNYGVFEVKLVVSNANGSDSLTVTNYVYAFQNPPAPVIQNFGGTLICTQPASSYQWFMDTTAIPGATNQVYTATLPGLYYILITDSNGCQSASNSILITGINFISGENFSINYDPDLNIIQISSNDNNEEMEFSIISTSGQMIFRKNLLLHSTAFQEKIPVLPFGIYFINLRNKRSLLTGKIAVIH